MIFIKLLLHFQWQLWDHCISCRNDCSKTCKHWPKYCRISKEQATANELHYKTMFHWITHHPIVMIFIKLLLHFQWQLWDHCISCRNDCSKTCKHWPKYCRISKEQATANELHYKTMFHWISHHPIVMIFIKLLLHFNGNYEIIASVAEMTAARHCKHWPKYCRISKEQATANELHYKTIFHWISHHPIVMIFIKLLLHFNGNYEIIASVAGMTEQYILSIDPNTVESARNKQQPMNCTTKQYFIESLTIQ